VRWGVPDDRVLPTSAAARQVGDALRTNFPTNTDDNLNIVTEPALTSGSGARYSEELSAVPGIARVTGPSGTWVHGEQRQPPGPRDGRFDAPGATWLVAAITSDPLSPAAQSLVTRVRAVTPPPGVSAEVGGLSASLVDQNHDLASRLPLALGLIALTTFFILFLFTGSVVLPAKALVLNFLSLTAVFGAIVWVFQQGHLSGLLGFTPTPTSTSMPLLLFCIAFGLSMDYEVFVLSRIKELHDAGETDADAVAHGLARTGRIVSTAAAILAVTFIAFGLSKVSFIKMFGLATALAIVMDATLVRGVLVPVFMRLAGPANWWAPGPLRRFHQRLGMHEEQ
jgi:putative drug exporter of the RND superfamily